MARRYDSEDSKRRILCACVRLFIEKGYYDTKITDILKAAGVTNGTFYNIFRTKDGVLMELTEFMLGNQFDMADELVKGTRDPMMLYAVETAIQLTITELNEHLREMYMEVYSNPVITEYIYQSVSTKLVTIFGKYMPECKESDFYELDIGTAGIMRGYMSRPCDKYFTIDRKLERFLEMTLNIYGVPQDRRREAIDYVLSMDICKVSNAVIEKVFDMLAMTFDYDFTTDFR